MNADQRTTDLTRIRELFLSLADGIRSLPMEDSNELMRMFRETGLEDTLNASLSDMVHFPEENPNPVMRISQDGNLLYCNRVAEVLLMSENQETPAINNLFKQISKDFSPKSTRRTLEYETGGRSYTIDVVPIAERGYINVYWRDITLQKMVETAREQLLADNQRQQALLDAIFDAEPSGLAVITGPDLRITYANPAYRFICPQNDADITGRCYEEIWSGSTAEKFAGQVREALLTGRPFIVKGFEHHYADGSNRIFTLQVRRMQWGNEPAALMILWDITEQSLSEAKFHDLAESITDNFVAYDKNMRCIYRNHAAKTYSQVEPEQMVGKSFEELFPSMVGSKLHKTYLQVQQTRKPAFLEEEYTNPRDGNKSTWEITVYPAQEGITVFSRDITEKKKAENLLKESQQREYARTAELGALMDAVPAAIWIARDRLCMDMISNKAGYEILQVSDGVNISKSVPREILETQPYHNFKDGREVPVDELPMQVAAATGKPAEDYEFDIVFDDGHTRTLFGNVVPLMAEDGTPSGALAAFLDITNRKATELILQESQERLQILQEAATDLLGGADPIDRLSKFFQNFSEKLGLEVYVQYNLAPDGSHLELSSWGGFPQKFRSLLDRLELGQAVCGMVAKTRQRIIVEDVQNNEDRMTTLIRKLGIRTYVCHPLISNGRLLGTLSFGSKKFDRLPPDTIELLRTFCHLVASAIYRKQAELEMQAHEQQYIGLLRNTNAVFYEIDFNTGRLTSFNDAMCLLSGYSREELESIKVIDLLEEDSQRRFSERMRKWLSGEKPEGVVEFQVKAKDGHIIDALLNVTFKRDAQGKPLGASVIAQDISARKRIETALRESEERFRQVLENSLDGAYRRDLLADRYDYLSPVTGSILGVPVDVMQEMPISEVLEHIHPEDRLAVAVSVDTGNITGKVRTNYRFLGQDGTYRWVADFSSTTRDSTGRNVYRTGNVRDIGEEIAIRQRLARDQRMLTVAGHMAHLGAWEVPLTSEGIPIYNELSWSDEAYRIFGYRPGEVQLTEEFFRRHIPQDQWESLSRIITRAVEELSPFTVEYQIRTKDDEIRTLLSHGESLNDAHGKPSKIVGALQDISSLRQLEANQVEYRTQLEVQRRLLEQREQERLQIARDLHDGPTQELIAASFALQAILLQNQDPSLKASLEELQQKIKQQLFELRAFSVQLRPPALDRFGLLTAVKSHAETFQDKHPDIRVRVENLQGKEFIPPELRLVFFRIYQEAMTNVARHSGATHVDVRLSMEDNLLCLAIEDNGSGFVPPRDWLKLARDGHLGLVGMRERAEAAGGKLIITNRLEGGTRIVVQIPAP